MAALLILLAGHAFGFSPMASRLAAAVRPAQAADLSGLDDIGDTHVASIRKEVRIDAHPKDAWAALRDWDAVHQRLVPGFVVDARLEGEDRSVTFSNGSPDLCDSCSPSPASPGPPHGISDFAGTPGSGALGPKNTMSP